MDGFNRLSLGNRSTSNASNARQRRPERSDPFNTQSMQDLIEEVDPRTGFNVSSMRNALMNDLDSKPVNDVEMEDVRPPSSAYASGTDVRDIEMEDAFPLSKTITAKQEQPLPQKETVLETALEQHTLQDTPKKNLLNATKAALFSPTTMGAEAALGLSSPKSSPKKIATAKMVNKSVATSPIQSPVKKHSHEVSEMSLGPPVGFAAAETSTMTTTSGPITNHYQIHLPPPWNIPPSHTEDTTVKTRNRLYAISSYLQILSNAAFAAFVGYVLFRTFEMFAVDVHAKKASYISKAIAESERCAREYVRNECRVDTRAPMLEEMCNQWEACMDLDPEHTVGTLRLYAEVTAEIINTFIETFAARSLIVGVIIIGLLLAIIYFSNFAFGYWRAKLYYKANAADSTSLQLR